MQRLELQSSLERCACIDARDFTWDTKEHLMHYIMQSVRSLKHIGQLRERETERKAFKTAWNGQNGAWTVMHDWFLENERSGDLAGVDEEYVYEIWMEIGMTRGLN